MSFARNMIKAGHKTGYTAWRTLTMSQKKIQGHFNLNICHEIPWWSTQP
jgi:hypothetical protein